MCSRLAELYTRCIGDLAVGGEGECSSSFGVPAEEDGETFGVDAFANGGVC
jgi:hypothetical protein